MVEKPTYQELEEKLETLERKLLEQKDNSKHIAINQKRLTSLWEIASMQAKDFKEICDTLIEKIVSMTESQYGFYGFVNSDEKGMTLYSWSKAVMDDCAIHSKTLHFEIQKSGVWGNAIRERKPVFYNNYTLKINNKKGIPEGHVSLTNLLSVPVFSITNKIVALGCVANKQGNYNNDDANQLTTYLSSAQLILENRKSEEDRKLLFDKAVSELKILRGILPLCSFCKKIRDDKGYWESVDVYIHKYSQAGISHGICPDCMKIHYAEEYETIMKNRKDK